MLQCNAMQWCTDMQTNGIDDDFVDQLCANACRDNPLDRTNADFVTGAQRPIVRSSLNHLSKVAGTVRQLVRDWTKEGQEERDQCYAPVIKELQRVLPITPQNKNQMMVFLPGSGLSRLMVELCACVKWKVGRAKRKAFFGIGHWAFGHSGILALAFVFVVCICKVDRERILCSKLDLGLALSLALSLALALEFFVLHIDNRVWQWCFLSFHTDNALRTFVLVFS